MKNDKNYFDQEFPEYKPGKKESNYLSELRSLWQNAYGLRNRPYRALGNMSLETYWRVSRDQFNGYEPENEGKFATKKDWKSRVFKPKTRNKVISTVASFIASGIGLDVSSVDRRGFIDRELSGVVEDLMDWTLEREDGDYLELLRYMEKTVTGTVFVQEHLAYEEYNVKEILEIDFETGQIKWEEGKRVGFKGPKQEIIPNEEVYLGDVYEPDVQRQPYVFRIKKTTYEEAFPHFSRWPNWKYVRPGNMSFFTVDQGNDEKERDAHDDVDRNAVQIAYYWNRYKDQMAIVANGVLLTPDEYPIPYPHKMYPLVKDIFEPFGDTRFAYGRSLPMKNFDDQKVVNEMWRMIIDSSKLATKPPIAVSTRELANTDIVIPGRAVVKQQGDTVERIPGVAEGVPNSTFNTLTLAERQTDENSIDPLLSGQAPAGDPTATEVRAIVGSAERVKGLNIQFNSHGLVQLARLRIPNMLWFLTHDEDFAFVVRDRVRVASGKDGRRVIQLTPKGLMPSLEDVAKMTAAAEQEGMPTDYVFVDRDMVFDYTYFVSVATMPKPKKNSASKLWRALQKYNLYAPNPLIDQAENTRMLVEALGDDPGQIMQKPQMAQQMGTPSQTPQSSPQLMEEIREEAAPNQQLEV